MSLRASTGLPKRLLGAHVRDRPHHDASLRQASSSASGDCPADPPAAAPRKAPRARSRAVHRAVSPETITFAGFRSRWMMSGRVGLHDGVGHLQRRVDECVSGERPPADGLVKGPALDVLHGDEVQPVGLTDLVDLHDVRVIDGRSGLRLAHEPPQSFVVRGQFGRQDLQGRSAVQPRVLGQRPGPCRQSRAA